MSRALLLLAVLLTAPGLTRAEEAHAPAAGAEAGAGAGTPATGDAGGALVFALAVGEVGYAATVTPGDAGLALLLGRADGASMADEGYRLAELGAEACGQAGYAFDPGAAAVLEQGKWRIEGGCK